MQHDLGEHKVLRCALVRCVVLVRSIMRTFRSISIKRFSSLLCAIPQKSLSKGNAKILRDSFSSSLHLAVRSKVASRRRNLTRAPLPVLRLGEKATGMKRLKKAYSSVFWEAEQIVCLLLHHHLVLGLCEDGGRGAFYACYSSFTIAQAISLFSTSRISKHLVGDTQNTSLAPPKTRTAEKFPHRKSLALDYLQQNFGFLAMPTNSMVARVMLARIYFAPEAL